MNLRKVLENVDYQLIQGELDVEIEKIAYDSRLVKANDIFVCVSGFKVDGHNFIDAAMAKGATVLVVEKNVNVPKNITVILVKSTRVALAELSINYFNNPSAKMTLIGVTGTNGKTSTTYLVKSVLDSIGKKVGIIGTIENIIGDRIIHTERTTPESYEVQELFATMEEEGVSHVVMEVSSHALDLSRVYGCSYDVAIFTNLTQDHLDYHKTMENYKKAKAKLFQTTDKCVINIDDNAGEYMASVSKGKVITIAIDKAADLKAKDIKITAQGVTFNLVYQGQTYPVKINIPGKFSIYNAMGAIGACLFMGIEISTIITALGNMKGVRGRFQTIVGKNGVSGIVDYAHTPDGLENILNTAKEFVKGKIITVFGCGGDRDKTKRPIMGEIAGNLSSYCIITSDNPRSEKPEDILLDVEEGTQKTKCPYIKIVDRKAAIFTAVKMAKAGDLIVVAGKGHETYQIFPDKTIHFDDAEVLQEAFQGEF